jgi:hypothetical protein
VKRYVVRKDSEGMSAWLSLYSPGSDVPDNEPGEPVFNNDRSKAVTFIQFIAWTWAWSVGGQIEEA